MKKPYYCSLAVALLFIASGVCAQKVSLKAVSGTYALQHVTVIPSPGNIQEDVTLIIKDGLVYSLGKNITIPAEAIRLKADSMLVYAGFIDGLSHAGIAEPKREERGPRPENPSNPSNNDAGITPQVDVRDVLNPKDKSISSLRELGFTMVHTVPRGQMLPGNGALILLHGDKVDEMVLRDHVSFFSQLDGARGVYPSTVIGVMAKYRELYKNAQLVQTDQATYKQGISGMEHPRTDRVLQAFYPVINGNERVMFKASSVLDIQRAIQLKKDLNFQLMLGGVKQAWDITGMIKEQNLPLFLSLDLPEWKKMEIDSTINDEKAAEQRRLQDRDSVMLYHYYTQPALLAKQSVSYGFSTLDAKPNDILTVLREMKKRGVSEDQLLAALTTQPASILGVSTIAGTVEKGKMANLVVTDKDIFEDKSSVRFVFVDGNMFEYEPGKKKEKGTKAEVKAEGKWNFTAETSEGTATGVITITGDQDTGLKGSLFYNQTGMSYPLSNVSLSGTALSFSLEVDAGGRNISADVILTIDKDTFEGTVTAGGSQFPIEGERVPE